MRESGMPDIPGLAELLGRLPLDQLGEPPKKEGGDEAPEAALLLKRGDGADKYFIRCSLPHSPPLEEGYVPKSQNFAFPGLKLPELCKKVEDALYDTEINYHCDTPVTPGPGHTNVIYSLLPRQEDPESHGLFYAAYRMLLMLS